MQLGPKLAGSGTKAESLFDPVLLYLFECRSRGKVDLERKGDSTAADGGASPLRSARLFRTVI